MFGSKGGTIDAIAITDSKNLYEAVHSIKTVEDKRLVGTIAEIKEGVFIDKLMQELRDLPAEHMIADGFSKQGASIEDLLRVLRTGHYSLPGG